MNKPMIRFSVILFFVLLSNIFSQTVFEDSKGENTIVQYTNGIVGLNLANSSIKVGAGFTTNSNLRFSIDLTAKSTEGTASLFSDGNFSPGFKATVNAGYTFESEKIFHTFEQNNNNAQILRLVRMLKSSNKILKRSSESGNKDGILDACNKFIDSLKMMENIINELKLESADEIFNKAKGNIAKNISVLYRTLNNVKDHISEANTSTTDAFVKESIKAIDANISSDKEGSIRKDLSDVYTRYLEVKMDAEAPSDLTWINCSFSLLADKYKMYDDSKPFEKQFADTLFTGPGVFLSFNKFFPSSRLIISMGVGVKADNNVSDFDKIEFSDTKTIKDATGATTRQTKKTITAYDGEYKKTTTFSTLLSGFWKPAAEMPFSTVAYLKYSANEISKVLTLGLGAFIVKQTNALIPIAGITAELNNKLDSTDNDKLLKKINVNLVLSYPINFNL